jgi:hypothetical protein
MSSYSVTILGTDFIGLSLAQTFVREFESEKISMIGRIPDDREKNDLSDLFSDVNIAERNRFPEAFEGESNIRSVVSQATDNLRGQLGWLGGELVDLKVDTDGFVLLVRVDDELRELHTHHVMATAPPVLDLVPGSYRLPGTDSAVTGLLLDKVGLDFDGSTEFFERTVDDQPRLWDFNFGLSTDDNGSTSNMKISATGQVAQGPTRADQLRNLVEAFESLPEPTEHYSKSFDKSGWVDTDLPEGFVETKTETLRNLLEDVLQFDEDPDMLTQKLEGLAGEVDSYSRFRSDPDLQRLRWQTLTAMNFAQPFLSAERTATVT